MKSAISCAKIIREHQAIHCLKNVATLIVSNLLTWSDFSNFWFTM